MGWRHEGALGSLFAIVTFLGKARRIYLLKRKQVSSPLIAVRQLKRVFTPPWSCEKFWVDVKLLKKGVDFRLGVHGFYF